MNFYIASKLENYEQVRHAAKILKKHGWKHTYDWTEHGSVKNTDKKTLTQIGTNEYQGIRDSDIVIVLTPQGRGTHTELGMAIALEKKVYIYHIDETYFQCDDNTSSFYWLPCVTRLTGILENALEKILADNTK